MIEFEKNTREEAKSEALKIQKEYGIQDSGGEALLRIFADAMTTELRCLDIIEAEGMVIIDRFHQVKPNPMLPVVRDARSQKLACLRALNLDITPLGEHQGRPRGC
jgi:phage terminase small subunit